MDANELLVGRPLPVPSPQTRHFWEGAHEGKLCLQQCEACAHIYFPPRPFCPRCACRRVGVVHASGKARLHSYVINHRAPKGWAVPYAIAVVELQEGPRMMSNIVECEQTPEALVLDMPLQVVFHRVSDDISLPLFRPLEAHR